MFKELFSMELEVTVYMFSLGLTLLVILGYGWLKILDRKFYDRAERLTNIAPQKENKFTAGQLAGLPQPVQRYFRQVLREGQPYVTTLQLSHTGFFRTGPNSFWASIKGEEFFSAHTPGFLWRGKTKWFSAEDSFISKQGRLTVRLFGLIGILRKQGDEMDHAEFFRWVAESVWFPTALLPSSSVKWEEASDKTAILRYTHQSKTYSFLVAFDNANTIASIETVRENGAGELKPWGGTYTDYHWRSGMLVPIQVEAAWYEDGIAQPYARFRLLEMIYKFN